MHSKRVAVLEGPYAMPLITRRASKRRRFAEAEADAVEVLRQQPGNVKALLRRANARCALAAPGRT